MARKRRKRDYSAEYKRRLARANELGYSKALARGHAGKDRLGLRASKFLGLEPGHIVRGTPRATLERLLESRYDFERTRRTVRKELARVLRVTQTEAREELVKVKGENANDYGLRREDVLADAKPSDLPITSELDFVQSMLTLGFTEREAYTLWFSP